MLFFPSKSLTRKSPDKLELIALIKDVAVEMTAAKTAQPTRDVIQGFVVFSTTAIKTLAPWGIERFNDLA